MNNIKNIGPQFRQISRKMEHTRMDEGGKTIENPISLKEMKEVI